MLYVEAQIFTPDAADGPFSTQSRESGGTGRRTGLRIQRATMGVQLPPLAPGKELNMKSDMKEVSMTKRVFTIEVPSDVVSKGFSDAYDDLRKRVKVPGFRPGKAPLTLLERRYAKEVEADLIKRLAPDFLMKGIKGGGVFPGGLPW